MINGTTLFLEQLSASQKKTIAIVDDLIAGKSVATICETHGVSKQYVGKIKKKYSPIK